MATKYMGEYYIPRFEKEVELLFGYDYDETGWGEIETPPTEKEIKEYENALKNFIENIDETVERIKEEAFEYYKTVKSPYGYGTDIEKEHSVTIDDKEKHFEYMKDLYSVQITKSNKEETIFIILSIDYEIDTEHKMDILLFNNEVIKVTEADETYHWNMEELFKIISEDAKQKLKKKA